MATKKWTAADLPSFAGRTVLITGANSGLGLIEAQRLGASGARVIMAVRSTDRGEAAAADVPGITEVRQLDLADLASIRAFAEGWAAEADPKIDVLINNAGIMHVPKGKTADGFELQIGTNHLGHFALTNLLLPHVYDRVVTVASISHRAGSIHLDDLNWEHRRYDRVRAYGQSKLANLLFSMELQRRLTQHGSRIRSLAAHPGYSATNLQTQTGNTVGDLAGRIGNAVIAQRSTAGALPILYAASQDLPGGSYVGPGGPFEVRGAPALAGRSREAGDPELARKLWELSASLTGVDFPGK